MLDMDAETVGAEDDFFELGGNSLTMVRLLLAVEDRFGIDMSVEEFFAESFTFGAGVHAVASALGLTDDATAPTGSGAPQ
jgi:acyl carrier protein